MQSSGGFCDHSFKPVFCCFLGKKNKKTFLKCILCTTSSEQNIQNVLTYAISFFCF